jgi:hypothetical protein
MSQNMFGKIFIFSVFILVGAMQSAFAQSISCSGTVTGTFDDVTVNGATCTLMASTVRGSVQVSNGGVLTTSGVTQVSGNILADGGGDVSLAGQLTVLGDVSMINSAAKLTVGPSTTLNSLTTQSFGDVIIQGSVGSVESISSKALTLNGGRVSPGELKTISATGQLTLCGAVLSGGLSVSDCSAAVRAVASTSCAASTITGSISIARGTGAVTFDGALTSASDLTVIERTGNVVLQRITLSDVLLDKITGNLQILASQIDSDVSIQLVTGSALLSEVSTSGDLSINSITAGLTIRNSDFGSEVVSVGNIDVSTTITGNKDLSLTVLESENVRLTGNTVRTASLNVNTGGVTINNNVFETLNCADNNPAPVGTGNTVTVLADGQCTGF